jgi:sugar phosphate isomerase/epimerase
MHCDRRAFLVTFGSAAFALTTRGLGACASPAGGTVGGRKIARVGLQLYTVRDDMQRDLPGTLARVAQIGYREVEFAGYFGRTPAEIRALLQQNGLTSPSSHIGYPDLAGGAWGRALSDAKAVGHEYVTVPWIPEEARRSADDYKRVAEHFNRAAQLAKDAGLRFAYHNHDFEFRTADGMMPYDLLLQGTDKSLVDFEMDLYWTVKGGQDPIAYFDRYPGRFTLVHVKDGGPAPERVMTEVGGGTIDFRRIFAHDADHGAHIRHYFVEHDQPKDPVASITKSYDYLSRLEY